MTFIYSLILSLVIVIMLSLIFREEAGFWLDKILYKIKRKRGIKKESKEGRTAPPIKKYCGFRDWSDQGGEICTIFELENGAEYFVSEEICQKCLIWERYAQWMEEGKKEKLSVTLIHTFHGSKPIVVETEKLNPELDKGLTFNDFVIKRRRVPWAGKAAIAVLTLVTYLVVYFSGVFTNPIVKAMPDTFYFYDEGNKAVSGSWNMRDTDPSSSADTTTICTNDDNADTIKYCALKPGINNDSFESSYVGPKKLGWMTDNDNLLWGNIASGTWYVHFKYNFTNNNANCTYDTNRIWFKVWKADSDLNNETVIRDWTFSPLSEGTSTISVSWSQDLVELSNEVLLVEFRWYIAFSCSSGTADSILTFYIDEGLVESLEIPTYEAIPENSIYFAFVVPFLPAIVKKFKIKEYFKKK